VITGYRCAVCGASVPIATTGPWRCPNASAVDRAHVLRIETDGTTVAPADDDPNPFIAYRRRMAWHSYAMANGMADADTVALVSELDDAIAAVDGAGFRVTPFGRADALSDEMGFERAGGVWVKDETGNVASSHKARHLMVVLLHLEAATRLGLWDRHASRLAIASCGNAALAAATLAAAAGWPLDVFVPPSADTWIVARLEQLGAHIVVCPRPTGDPARGPAGDPCIHRFREAVDAGAVPFSVQGPDDALCLDGGRTIGWELAAQLDGVALDRVFVQVGGGALATAIGDSLRDEAVAPPAMIHAVQTAGCAPFARAWSCAQEVGVSHASHHWNECMRPWEVEPISAASGILDDETYDWLGVIDALAGSGGSPIVASEDDVLAANELAARATAIAVDHTGSAGLAGLRALRRRVGDSECVAVLFTGRFRPSDVR
jgi:threonine dehydratase